MNVTMKRNNKAKEVKKMNDVLVITSTKKGNLVNDLKTIGFYTYGSIKLFTERNIPLVRETVPVLFDRVFLAADPVIRGLYDCLTAAVELLSIGGLALTVFLKWFYRTEFARELRSALGEILNHVTVSTVALLRETAVETKSAWIFRAELINEWR